MKTIERISLVPGLALALGSTSLIIRDSRMSYSRFLKVMVSLSKLLRGTHIKSSPSSSSDLGLRSEFLTSISTSSMSERDSSLLIVNFYSLKLTYTLSRLQYWLPSSFELSISGFRDFRETMPGEIIEVFFFTDLSLKDLSLNDLSLNDLSLICLIVISSRFLTSILCFFGDALAT